MIDLSKPTRVWIRTNTKAGLEKTGVVAVVMLCFKGDPESRISLWYAKNNAGQFEYMTPSFPIEIEGGESKKIECLHGEFTADLVKLAAEAQARLKKEFGKPRAGKLYKIAEKVEEVNQNAVV